MQFVLNECPFEIVLLYTTANTYMKCITWVKAQPTTCDHMNIKYRCRSPCKPYGDPSLITHRDLQKVYTLNRYDFPIFIYYKETMKILVAHID